MRLAPLVFLVFFLVFVATLWFVDTVGVFPL